MAHEAEFKSIIRAKPLGGWYIELIETATGEKAVCDTLDEYMEKIEQMGADYGPGFQVAWETDPEVDPKIMDIYVLEIRGLMQKYQDEAGIANG
jgi:hypothetical protein